MPALDFELIPGGDITVGQNPSASYRYRAIGVPKFLPFGQDFFSYLASEAMQYIPLSISHAQGTLYRQDMQIHENVYARYYEISVPYGPDEKQSGAYSISVDQTGGTVHVTAGTRIAGYGEDADAVDNGGLIGVDGDEVRGVDIPVEESKINVSFRAPEAVLSQAYVRAVGRLVGFPNADPFLGYEAGEVVYLGGNFTESETEATANFSFAISYNRTNFEVGGITIEEKKGWDVISPAYKTEVVDDHEVKTLSYIEIIRPAGREWVSYANVFGFGG